MKVRYLFSLIIAAVLMMISPMTMACASCHAEQGVDNHQVTAAIGGGSSNVVDPTDTKTNAKNTELMNTSGVSALIASYIKPRASEGYAISDNDGGDTPTANKQVKPYAGVTAA
jgi:hypothetical protein